MLCDAHNIPVVAAYPLDVIVALRRTFALILRRIITGRRSDPVRHETRSLQADWRAVRESVVASPIRVSVHVRGNLVTAFALTIFLSLAQLRFTKK